MALPEVDGQLFHARKQELGVLEHLVVEIILCGDPERARLDPHVDVLADQGHLPLGVQVLQVHHHGEDLVVSLAIGER